MPGQLQDTKPSDAEVEELVSGLHSQIEEKLGKPLGDYTVHSYKTQVVAGINYFVKLILESSESVHVRIYKHFSGTTSVHSVQTGKVEGDEIDYF